MTWWFQTLSRTIDTTSRWCEKVNPILFFLLLVSLLILVGWSIFDVTYQRAASWRQRAYSAEQTLRQWQEQQRLHERGDK